MQLQQQQQQQRVQQQQQKDTRRCAGLSGKCTTFRSTGGWGVQQSDVLQPAAYTI
jgi:hypothetical protein